MALFQCYNTGDDGFASTATAWLSQSFTVTQNQTITSIKLKLYRVAAESPGTVTASIRATSGEEPTGSDLDSGTTDGDTLGEGAGNAEWREIAFTGTVLTVGVKYAICLRTAGTDGVVWRKDGSSPTYSGGNGNWASTTSGSTWYEITDRDYMFECYGLPRLVDKTYSRTLVAIGNNEVWYGVSETPTELSAATGDIDCDEPLMAIEAFQKVFIVNKTNLKVADFINTKINTSNAGTYPCTKGMTLEGGNSGAQMIVDYADGVTDGAAANVYGFRITTDTFTSGETVTGTNSAGNTVSFATSAAETAPPHWYDWTVFGNDTTTYGTMPTSASLISLYRGRIVINDDQRPHAWYMFKVEDPWKVKHDYNNDGDISAITYSSTKVGEIGDILTAYIDYKDDLFIFGGANSLYLLVGDPLAEGQLARITKSTGIWGANAWCIDDNNNLYFFGSDGVYKMPISTTVAPPENISKFQLPALVKDWDLDKSLHRVTLSFDPIENGILVTKTTLSDGTCESYWFDLTLKGWFPESYPTSCGIFSSCFYPATDETYRKFLVGCTDGYIREFDWSTKDDATTSSTTAISSYLTIIKQLAEDGKDGLLQSMNIVLGGGAAGGDFSDTDGLSYMLYTANAAETVLEKMKAETAWATATVYAIGDLVVYDSVEYRCITAHTSDSSGPPNEEPDTNTTDWLATAFTSGSWTGTGYKNKIRPRIRGQWCGIKLYNSTASETFAIERLLCNILPKGE